VAVILEYFDRFHAGIDNSSILMLIKAIPAYFMLKLTSTLFPAYYISSFASLLFMITIIMTIGTIGIGIP